MNAPMASDTWTSSAIPATSTARPTKHTVRSSSCSAPMMRPTTDDAVAGDERHDHEEAERLGERHHGVARGGRFVEHRLQRGEVDGEEEVLDDHDPEDQARLPVGEAVHLHQDLGDDRRRRDAHRAGEHQRLTRAPAEREPERESGRRC